MHNKYKYIETASEELCEMRTKARALMKEYEAADYNDNSKKHYILEQLFDAIGSNVFVGERFHCEYGKNISIGSDVIIGPNCIFIDNEQIKIGNCIMCSECSNLYCISSNTSRRQVYY